MGMEHTHTELAHPDDQVELVETQTPKTINAIIVTHIDSEGSPVHGYDILADGTLGAARRYISGAVVGNVIELDDAVIDTDDGKRIVFEGSDLTAIVALYVGADAATIADRIEHHLAFMLGAGEDIWTMLDNMDLWPIDGDSVTFSDGSALPVETLEDLTNVRSAIRL